MAEGREKVTLWQYPESDGWTIHDTDNPAPFDDDEAVVRDFIPAPSKGEVVVRLPGDSAEVASNALDFLVKAGLTFGFPVKTVRALSEHRDLLRAALSKNPEEERDG